MNKINIRDFIDGEITPEEALALTKIKGPQLMELFTVANEIREKYCGNKVHTCTISNAKSGKCEEDCKFCAQSVHYNTNVTTYDLKNKGYNGRINSYKECLTLSKKIGYNLRKQYGGF
ncbi:hypothetical protein [Psychrilyobacter sp.]|uniref:hypothetical protein n=1 Tax=Psychrilyobacter sp. TaxID=2586924 RepID=UPI003016953A